MAHLGEGSRNGLPRAQSRSKHMWAGSRLWALFGPRLLPSAVWSPVSGGQRLHTRSVSRPHKAKRRKCLKSSVCSAAQQPYEGVRTLPSRDAKVRPSLDGASSLGVSTTAPTRMLVASHVEAGREIPCSSMLATRTWARLGPQLRAPVVRAGANPMRSYTSVARSIPFTAYLIFQARPGDV